MIYYFRTEQFLPTDIETAWQFFASAKNLAVITPPELDFKVLTQLDDKEIYEGMLIDYKLRPLWGIPLRWQTEISRVKRGVSFTDRQSKGPYSIWEHTHTFMPQKDGVLMKDEVKYKIPFGFIGSMMHTLIISRKVAGIFSYRRDILKKMFVRK